MRRILTALTAIVTTMSVPFISVAPAAASTPDLSSVTFDCSTYSWVPWAQELPLYTSTVTVTFENCSSDYRLSDPLSSTFASTTAGDVDSSGTFVLDTVTIDGEVELYILDETASMYAILDFVAPYEMVDPSGNQLADSSQDIPADAPSTVWGTPREAANESEIQIGGIDGCEIEAGEHIYATQSFTVTTAGEYTFRVTGTDPVAHYFNRLSDTGSELDDPMVALYSTFNLLDPNSDIVGCNDDLNDLEFGGHNYDDNPFNVTEQGDYVEGHFSYFSTTLDPGDYMLVFTTWGVSPADEWAVETPDGGTVYFDVWGPNSGLTLTDVDPVSREVTSSNGELAATGVDPAFGLWSATSLLGAGIVLMAVRRRRDSTSHL